MSRGEPLTDADRGPWLAALSEIIAASVASGQRAVISCSALKPHYRDILVNGNPSGTVGFILLEPSKEELAKRVEARGATHFMPAALLESQLQTLEYSASDLFMHLKPATIPGIMPPPEELAAAVVHRLTG